MRVLAAFLVFIAMAEAQAAAEPDELVTAANAILCLSARDVDAASAPGVAQSQQRLRGLHCLRTEPGIPLTVLERTQAGIWKVSFRPDGIPGGVALWGRVASFAMPDGEPLAQTRATSLQLPRGPR